MSRQASCLNLHRPRTVSCLNLYRPRHASCLNLYRPRQDQLPWSRPRQTNCLKKCPGKPVASIYTGLGQPVASIYTGLGMPVVSIYTGLGKTSCLHLGLGKAIASIWTRLGKAIASIYRPRQGSCLHLGLVLGLSDSTAHILPICWNWLSSPRGRKKPKLNQVPTWWAYNVNYSCDKFLFTSPTSEKVKKWSVLSGFLCSQQYVLAGKHSFVLGSIGT